MLWDHFGITPGRFGTLLDHFDVTWNRFWVSLGPLKDHLGVALGSLRAALE